MRVGRAYRLTAAAALLIVAGSATLGGRAAGPQGLIVFASAPADDINPQTYVVRADGGGRRNVSRAPNTTDRQPLPSPDGRKLLFVAWIHDEPELWASRADGSARRRLAVHAGDGTWSPDGRLVAFVDQRSYALKVVAADGTGLRTLRHGLVQTPAWSPDGARIAFAARDIGEVHVVDADGRNERRLGGPGELSVDSGPTWTKDGRIVVSAAPVEQRVATGPERLYIFDADGTGVRTVSVPRPSFATTDDPVALSEAQPSPDGKRIVFVSSWEPTTETEVGVIRDDGSGFQRLTRRDDAGRNPVWSPDGRRIALTRRGDIVTVRPDGSGERVVAKARPFEFLDSPAWAPDGRTIFFTGQADSSLQQTDLFTIRPDGTGLRQLTRTRVSELAPRWSADGERLAFLQARRLQDRVALYVMRADGTHRRLIYSCRQECSAPAWSPDGTQILFAEDGNPPRLKVVPAAGGRPRIIGTGTEPSWSRQDRIAYAIGAIYVADASGSRKRVVVRGGTGDRIDDHPAWSPDGRRIAFVTATGEVATADPSGRRKRILVPGPAGGSGPDWKP